MLATLTSQSVSGTNFSNPCEAPSVTAKEQRHEEGTAKSPLPPRRAARGVDRRDARLVEGRGAENFTLADACPVAGVTSAAPYRHFRGKQEILEEIASRGFDELRSRPTAMLAKKGEGTLEGIIAMRQTYVAFAVEETAVFRLMFGQEPSLKKAERVLGTRHECFGYLIDQVALYTTWTSARDPTRHRFVVAGPLPLTKPPFPKDEVG
jgi:AcrR family transcriptional regulator